MALRIVRASQDERLQTPLRAWYGGQHDEAVALLAAPGAGRLADDATQVVAAALATEPERAGAIGTALTRWKDEAAAYRIIRRAGLLEAAIGVAIGRSGPKVERFGTSKKEFRDDGVSSARPPPVASDAEIQGHS